MKSKQKWQNSNTGDTLLGEKGFNINSDNEYFTIVEITSEKEKLETGTLVLKADIFSESYVEALIVTSITHGKTDGEWHSIKIEKQIEKLNKWNNIIYFRNFYELKEGDKIKLYIWNLKKCDFAIDNITVDFYPF